MDTDITISGWSAPRGTSNVVVEVKRTLKGKKDLETLATMALEQIHGGGYTHGLKGRTLLYGIAFVIKSEDLDL